MIIYTIVANYAKLKFRIPIMWYINIPKILVSIIAIYFIFGFDYETKQTQFPNFDNMLMSMFLVGMLALIELFSCLATMVKDVCDMFTNK